MRRQFPSILKNDDIKITFAEATMKHSKELKLKVKGRKKTIKVFEVTGIIDSLSDERKYPKALVESYRHCLNLITVPEEVILPIEALEGAIGHSRGVALLSYAISDILGIPEHKKKQLINAAFIADLGKEIVPHHLLNRSGSLLEDEYKLVLEHAEEGARMMQRMGYEDEYLVSAVRHSHEHFDGSGHPNGLSGEDIPLPARIIAVADAYDGMVSWRTYHEQWDIESALVELEKGSARGLFDPDIVKIVKHLFHEPFLHKVSKGA